MTLYDIVRFWRSGRQKIIRTGQTLEEAQAWCRRDDSHGPGWFDGFRRA